MNTQLYGGDIYLMGGSHFLMKDLERKQVAEGAGGAGELASNELYSNRLKFSQASTTTGSEIQMKSGSLNR